MILISKQYQLQLEHTVPKILQIVPALNGFLFVATTQDGLRERIVHVDNNGKMIWQNYYKDSIDFFGMLQEDRAVVLNVNDNKIDLINLNNYTISSVNHQYQMDDTSYMKIVVFSETNIFAVIEKNIIKEDLRFIITYYRREEQQIKKIITIDHTDSIKTTDIRISKVNERSKIAIWSSNAQRNILVFQTIDFVQQALGVQQITTNIIFPHTLNKKYHQQTLLISILHIKQISTNKFLLVCDTNRMGQQQEQNINNNYVLDTEEKTIDEAGFIIPSNQNYHFCDYYSFGSYSAFLTFQTASGEMGKSPIFYIDNKNQRIVAKEEWKATNKSSFIVNEFDASMLIESIHDNANVKQIKIITKRLAEEKEIYLHFMLHIDEEFDDDLLSDAVGLLISE